MAYVNGEWLVRDEREKRINLVAERANKIRELVEVGKATDYHTQLLRDDIEELRKLKRVHRAEHDMLYFMTEYFGEEMNPGNMDNLLPKGVTVANSAKFHKELCELLNEITTGVQKGNVAWSVGRGHAKTAYLSNGYLAHTVVFRHKRYVVQVSETTDVAGAFISWTRNQLKFNGKLREDFGELLHAQKTRNDIDNNVEFVTTTGTKVEAKGIGAQVRGLRYGSTRPDLFILDDLESRDNTNTPELIDKNKNWFKEELLPALSRDDGLCIYMGTIVSYDSLLDYVIKKRRDFTSRKFPAILSWAKREDLWAVWQKIYRSDDADAGVKARAFYEAHETEMLEGVEVLWEAMFSYYDLMVLREENGIKAFNQEYLGNPTDEERQIFKAEHFTWFNDTDLDGKEIHYFAGIDFAMGKEKGDYSVIATIARNEATGICYVVDVYMERIHPNILLQEVVKRALHYQYEIIAVESQMAQEFFADMLSEELIKHGYPAHTRLQHIKQRTRKALRIEALLTDIQNARLRFKQNMRATLEQFEMYPMHRHDDAPDAIAMAYGVAKGGNVSVRTAKKRTR